MTEFDRYWWCRADRSSRPRSILSLGPHWLPHGFYDPEEESKKWGKFDHTRYELKFDPASHAPIQDFIYLGNLFMCKPEIYALFAPLIARVVNTFDMKVSDQDYILFVPKLATDKFDYERSEFLHLSSTDNIPSALRKVALTSQPEHHAHFMRLSWSKFKFIVTDAFKEIYDDNALTGLRFSVAYDSAVPLGGSGVMH